MIGKPGDNAIALARVSDPGDVNKGDSYEDQEGAARRIADPNQWNLLRIFKESFSAQGNQRPVIEEIVDYIKSSPVPIHHLIVRSIDRFTRAGAIEYGKLKARMEALGVNVVDSQGLIQPKQNTLEDLGFEYSWSVYSPSETAELVEADAVNKEIRRNLTRIVRKEILLTLNGYKVGSPADGYLNKEIYVDGKKRVIEVPDPERAHFFIDMFELRASGKHTDKEIVARVNAMGYRSKMRKRWNEAHDTVIGYILPRPLSVKRFQEIVQRPIYCGVRVGKWTKGKPIKTKYPGLVSIETFNAANRGKVVLEAHKGDKLMILYDVKEKPKRLRNNPTYPYKNVVMCPHCKVKPFLGSASRGKLGKRYPAYHCHRGHYVRIPKREFEEAVESCLASVKLDPAYLDKLEDALLRTYSIRQGEIEDQAARITQNVSRLKAKKDAAVSSIIATDNDIVRRELEARVQDLAEQISEAEAGGAELRIGESDVRAFKRRVSELVEHPVQILKDAHVVERQRTLWDLVFDRLPTWDEIRSRTPKLSLVFRLYRDFLRGGSLMVPLERIEWNTLEDMILAWNSVFTEADSAGRQSRDSLEEAA